MGTKHKSKPATHKTTPASDGAGISIWEAQARRPVVAPDGLSNVIAGLGTDRDKATATGYGYSAPQTRDQLEAIYENSWAGGKIVDVPVDDMVRKWATYMWDGRDDEPDRALEDEEGKHDVRAKVTEAMKWAGLYGGAKIVVGLKGQDDMSQPLVMDSIRRGDLRYLHVVDRWRIAPVGELDKDIESPNFSKPKFYQLADTTGTGVLSASPRIHWSRLISFDGKRLPWYSYTRNGYWHASELQRVIDQLKSTDSAMASLTAMFFEANVDVITSEGINQLISMKKGEETLIKRFQNAALLKSINRVLLLDGKEKYDRKQLTFSGLADLIDKYFLLLSGAADIPLTRFFGQSPAGFSTGDADIRNYYDKIAAKRETKLRPPLTRLCEILVRSALGRMPEGFRLEFPSLWEMTDTEKSTVETNRATRDKTYVELGVLDPGQVARELKERGTYQTMSQEDVDLVSELSEPVDAGGTEEGVKGQVGSENATEAKTDAPTLTATAMASIMTVNEARAVAGLPAWPDAEGNLTVAEFQAKHAGTIATAAAAEAGQDMTAEPPPNAAQGPQDETGDDDDVPEGKGNPDKGNA